jgi:hypothetical protein
MLDLSICKYLGVCDTLRSHTSNYEGHHALVLIYTNSWKNPIVCVVMAEAGTVFCAGDGQWHGK